MSHYFPHSSRLAAFVTQFQQQIETFAFIFEQQNAQLRGDDEQLRNLVDSLQNQLMTTNTRLSALEQEVAALNDTPRVENDAVNITIDEDTPHNYDLIILPNNISIIKSDDWGIVCETMERGGWKWKDG